MMTKTKTEICPVPSATRSMKPQIKVVRKIGNSTVGKQFRDFFELRFSSYVLERITSGNQLTRFFLSAKDLQTIKNRFELMGESSAAVRASLKRLKTELKATNDKLEASKADQDDLQTKLEATLKNGAEWRDKYHQQERIFLDIEARSDDDRPPLGRPNPWDVLQGRGKRLHKVSG